MTHKTAPCTLPGCVEDHSNDEGDRYLCLTEPAGVMAGGHTVTVGLAQWTEDGEAGPLRAYVAVDGQEPAPLAEAQLSDLYAVLGRVQREWNNTKPKSAPAAGRWDTLREWWVEEQARQRPAD